MKISLDSGGGIARIVFSSANGMNLLNSAAIHELMQISRELQKNQDLRVLTIRSEGNVFGAGGDLTSFKANELGCLESVKNAVAELNQAILNLYQLPAIVICAVHGVVAGGSMGLMNVADLVIAAKGTRFNTAYTKIAASPDVGSSWFLPRLVGHRKAMEWLLLGENFDADEARLHGLINWVVPAEQLSDVTEKLANRLLHGPRESYKQIKGLLRAAEQHDLPNHLEVEQSAFASAVAQPDFIEGVQALLQNRSPHYKA